MPCPELWHFRHVGIAGLQTMKVDEMKVHSATSAGTGNRNQFFLALPRKENVVLAAGVALAFIFVTACIFTLG